jgi:hypothetical protein
VTQAGRPINPSETQRVDESAAAAPTHDGSKKGATLWDFISHIFETLGLSKIENLQRVWKAWCTFSGIIVLLATVSVLCAWYLGFDFRNLNAHERAVPNLSGAWEYRCTANDGLTFDHGGDQHGGVVTIHQRSGLPVPSFSVAGRRKWTRNGTTIDSLKNPIPWDSKDGSFVTEDRIQFPYEATSKKTSRLRGYVQVTVELSDGKAHEMSGTFYYIKEDDTAIQGTTEFRRIQSGNLIWGTGR